MLPLSPMNTYYCGHNTNTCTFFYPQDGSNYTGVHFHVHVNHLTTSPGGIKPCVGCLSVVCRLSTKAQCSCCTTEEHRNKNDAQIIRKGNWKVAALLLPQTDRDRWLIRDQNPGKQWFGPGPLGLACFRLEIRLDRTLLISWELPRDIEVLNVTLLPLTWFISIAR